MNNSLKCLVFDSCVLPILTYGAKILTLTKASANKKGVALRAMERSKLGILSFCPTEAEKNSQENNGYLHACLARYI